MWRNYIIALSGTVLIFEGFFYPEGDVDVFLVVSIGLLSISLAIWNLLARPKLPI